MKAKSPLFSQKIRAFQNRTFLKECTHSRGLNGYFRTNVHSTLIRSFFRLVALRDPDSIGVATRVLAIPNKREDKKLIAYLTRSEMQALLATPDASKWSGRRDYALLLTLYNSGARVSEITALRRGQVCFDTCTFLQLTGKGRKERTVPLWQETARVLKAWFEELGGDTGQIAFPNARGKALSREGVDYLLKQAVQRAIPACPSLATKKSRPMWLDTRRRPIHSNLESTSRPSPCGSVMKVLKRLICIFRPILPCKAEEIRIAA